MAVDVYNDCLIETVSARSWPVRSLACLASDHRLQENGAAVEFVLFTPASSDLHYRDLNYYKQMLDVIHELDKERIYQMFNRCTVFDSSCDKQMLDHKFLSGRIANSDGSESVRRHAYAREKWCHWTTGSGEQSFGSDRR